MSSEASAQGARGVHFSVAEFDRARILNLSADALKRPPATLTAVRAPAKSDPHAFYSERVPQQVDAPVPQVFEGHTQALLTMNRNLSALTAAWRLTGEPRYFQAAVLQMRQWFLDESTRMIPSLDLAGVVPGVDDDRHNGVITTVALAETARAIAFLCASPLLPDGDAAKIRAWFTELLSWFTDSKKGSIARQTKTLEAICWTMQAAEFARLTHNDIHLRACSHLFRDSLLRQMHFDGYFPLALQDENPYAASMFTLECMGSACESLSTPFESLWSANLPDGRGMHSAVAWAAPFLRNRSRWPNVADRHGFGEYPVRQNALLFAGRAYDLPEYTDLWKSLRADFTAPALQQTHPITQPALWAVRPPA